MTPIRAPFCFSRLSKTRQGASAAQAGRGTQKAAPAASRARREIGSLMSGIYHQWVANILTAIRAVNVDVTVGEIAGPYSCRTLAQAQIDGDLHLPAGYRFCGAGFVILHRSHAFLGDDMAAERDFELVAIGCL